MNRTIAWAGGAILAGALSACAAGPHTDGSMLSGIHQMPAPKGGVMSDQAMPSQSPDCTNAALANMPSEHRQACEKNKAIPSTP